MEKYKMKNLIKFSKWLQSLQYRHATQTEMITLLFNNEILISKVKLLNKKRQMFSHHQGCKMMLFITAKKKICT